MKRKMIDKAEAEFDFRAIIPASLVGPLMAFMDGKAQIEIALVKEIKQGGNAPKGAIVAAISELLAANSQKMLRLSLIGALINRGFTKKSINTFLYSARFKKAFNRKGEMISLKKGA